MKKVMMMTAAATTGAVSVTLKNRLATETKAMADAGKNFRGFTEEEGNCAGAAEEEPVRKDAKNIVLCKKLCNAQKDEHASG